MVEVRELSKRFGDVLAVDGVSFACRPGEIFGLLGENGAGKTTTLRIIATLLTPTSGTAVVNGFSVTTEPAEVRRSIGLISADSGLYDRLTPRETVRYFGRLYDMDDRTIRRRSEEIFELLDMKDYADRRTGQFSKGMKQKVSIARTLVHDPPVLLLDEPTAGLDVSAVKMIDDFILRAKERGKTIIFSSHIMGEVEKLCDRVAIVSRGRVVAAGTITELKQNDVRARFEDVFLRLVGDRS